MPVTEPSRAVFLSYASQDANAAQGICAALRTAGIEVWFDQSELRGGDAWDQKIRRELRDCAIFIPVISANTTARHEGYFRLEWDLADQRSHMIARNRAFIVPVSVDETPERSADTPESFQRVQWTRLPAGETSPAFVERIQRLLSGEAASDAGQVQTAGAIRRASSRRRRIGALTVAAVAAALLIGGYAGLRRLNQSSPAVTPAISSIAVLPLANEGGEASEQYFSDGISEDLITALSQFQGLKVIGRSSAFKFRDAKEDSRSIGAQLGVAHLLEGSVRRAGEMVRVSAELIDTTDGSTQWSEHYDRPYKDLFALQDDITRAVVGALQTKLLPNERAAAQGDRPPGGNLDAYNALLQGRFYESRNTEPDVRKAIELYTQATELDHRYAMAWSHLSRAWIIYGGQFLEVASAEEEANAKARAAADAALSLAPELAATHVARGYLLWSVDLDWRAAEAEFRQALALAPNDGATKFNLGILLATVGQVERAIELTRQALGTDPLRANWYNGLAVYLLGLNRLDEAERMLRRAIELQPGAASYHEQLTTLMILRGNAAAALAAAQQEPPGVWRDLALALARQVGTDASAADAALRSLINKYASVAPYQIAEVYALRGDAKQTFEWLDRAWSNHDGGVGTLLYDPLIRRYKDDPRFAAFCRKVGLPVPGSPAT